MLAAGTAFRLDRDDDSDGRDGQQRPRLSLMTELPAGPPSTGRTVGTLAQRLGWIARRRPRGGPRVLLQLLPQLVDRVLHLLHGGFQTLHGLLQSAYPC